MINRYFIHYIVRSRKCSGNIDVAMDVIFDEVKVVIIGTLVLSRSIVVDIHTKYDKNYLYFLISNIKIINIC